MDANGQTNNTELCEWYTKNLNNTHNVNELIAVFVNAY